MKISLITILVIIFLISVNSSMNLNEWKSMIKDRRMMKTSKKAVIFKTKKIDNSKYLSKLGRINRIKYIKLINRNKIKRRSDTSKRYKYRKSNRKTKINK